MLEGVYWKTQAPSAKAIDPFTWKLKGKTEYFTRIRHVVRPQDGSPAVFSLGGSAVRNGKVMGSVTQRDANEAIGRALAGIERGVQGVSIHVAQSFANLPADALAEATNQKVTATQGTVHRKYASIVFDTQTWKE